MNFRSSLRLVIETLGFIAFITTLFTKDYVFSFLFLLSIILVHLTEIEFLLKRIGDKYAENQKETNPPENM